MFWDVSINTGKNSRFSRHEICVFFKKKVLKTKTNLHFVHRKISKGKKTKIKEMNKGTFTTKKKKIVLRNLKLNLRRNTIALVLVEDTEVTNKEGGKT